MSLWLPKAGIVNAGGPADAFPVIQGTQNYETDTLATSHTIDLPSGIASGELLMLLVTSSNNITISTPTGWTLLDGMSTAWTKSFMRDADGTEGTTLGITLTGGSGRINSICQRISGAVGTSGVEKAFTTGNSPSSLTPSWGTKKTLWGTYFAGLTSNWFIDTYPTSYDLNRTLSRVLPATGNTTYSAAAACYKNLEAASDTPEDWVIDGSGSPTGPRCLTFAIEPA